MGCSSLTPEPQIQVVTNTVRTTVPIVARPKGVQLNDIKIYVVNEDNYEEFIQEFKAKNGEVVYIAISVKDYENLSLNIAELRRYIEQQKQVIVYYEEAVNPEDVVSDASQ
jgi:fructose-1,6-bisphosphatase/sedoheptulose 1,7-bisphosphatase-like protein